MVKWKDHIQKLLNEGEIEQSQHQDVHEDDHMIMEIPRAEEVKKYNKSDGN